MALFQDPSDHVFDPAVPQILPYEKMYLVQIGNKPFRLSGASLSSDAPSYFTEYFSKRQNSVSATHVNADDDDALVIDRSPQIFELIYHHLQGYFVHIRDEVEFTMLYADAMYYNLPRLRAQLQHSDFYYACIGGESFRVPRGLFWQDGNSPNYFELTYSATYADIEHIFLSKKLIRPPPQSPPFVNRSPALFKDILALLSGATLKLDDEKRQSLILECRYYRLQNLEQRLLKCSVGWNPLLQRSEIILNLCDIKKAGLSLPPPSNVKGCISTPSTRTPSPKSPLDDEPVSPPPKKPKVCTEKNWAMTAYKRPFVDLEFHELLFQIDIPDVTIQFNKRSKTIHVCLSGEAAHRFEKVFGGLLLDNVVDVATYWREPSLNSKPSRVLALPACMSLCDFKVNGVKIRSLRMLVEDPQFTSQVPDLTSKDGATALGIRIYLTKSLWKLGIINGELMMVAIKAEGISSVREHNRSLEFL